MSPSSPSPSLDAVGGRSSSSTSQQYDIHDLRHLSPPSASLLSQLRAGLQPSAWLGKADDPWRFTKSLPTMLLYDERGLQIYEKCVLPSLRRRPGGVWACSSGACAASRPGRRQLAGRLPSPPSPHLADPDGSFAPFAGSRPTCPSTTCTRPSSACSRSTAARSSRCSSRTRRRRRHRQLRQTAAASTTSRATTAAAMALAARPSPAGASATGAATLSASTTAASTPRRASTARARARRTASARPRRRPTSPPAGSRALSSSSAQEASARRGASPSSPTWSRSNC